MHLHIIGGFLGSGKTTAIIGAAKYLAGQGIRVGVITNDQGRHLVDTSIIRAQNLPAMEVTGGCFCCNLDDLNERLAQLVEAHQPQVIFAESVGSCADVVATVVKPLLDLDYGAVTPNSYSVFADIRLLRRFLKREEMPFSEGVNYIYGQQIEEAGLLVINKADLLTAGEVKEVLRLAREAFCDKPVITQNSLDEGNIEKWVDALQAGKYPLPERSLEIDYERYADGEGRFIWMDRTYEVKDDAEQMPKVLDDIITSWQAKIMEQGWTSGHVKVVLQTEETVIKMSLGQTDFLQQNEYKDFIEKKEHFRKNHAVILLNVLIEGKQEEAVTVIENEIKKVADRYKTGIEVLESFNRRPGYPKPTRRIRG